MTVTQSSNPTPATQTAPGYGRPSTYDDVILEVKDLRVHYATPTGDVIAVNGVNFEVHQGELVGLVGESGCGKTTTAMAILRLVQPPGRIVHGQAILNGTDIMSLNERQLRQVRWSEMALIPQGAMNSLNPGYEDQEPNRR